MPPSISPSGIKLAGEEEAEEEKKVVTTENPSEKKEEKVKAEVVKEDVEDVAGPTTSTPTEAIGKDNESTTTSISQQSVALQTTQALNNASEPNSSMSRVTSRTPSTGSESLQNQVRIRDSEETI